MESLRERIRTGNAALSWWQGIRGLTLRFDFLRSAGVSNAFLDRWLRGRPLDAPGAVPRHARNHPSCRENEEWAEREFSRLSSAGKVTLWAPGAPKPAGLNINPCALILKPRTDCAEEAPETDRFKARLIVDLRRGRVNEFLPEVPVNYGTLEQAVSRLTTGSWMFVLDLQDCFFNWRVAEDDTFLLGFYVSSTRQYGKYNFLPFGLASAPGTNDENIKEILRVLVANTGVSLLDFVDDFLGAAGTEAAAWRQLCATVDFLLACGIPVSQKASGVRPPAQRQLWIGWIFDTVSCVVTVSPEKCSRFCVACADVLQADNQRTLRGKTLAAVAGLASHLAELLPQARRRMHPIWADFNAANVYAAWRAGANADPLIQLSEQSRDALHYLQRVFATPPVRQMFCQGGSLSCWGPKSPEFQQWESLAERGEIQVIETDASTGHGWSYHICSSGRVVSGVWPPDFAFLEEFAEADAINYKELWVAVECVRREPEFLRGWRVLFRVDNTSAVHYINIRYGRKPHLERLAQSLDEAELAASCWSLAAHLPGRFNFVADSGSRDASFAFAWRSDPFHHAMLRRDLFLEVQNRMGVLCTVDLFCDREGLTALAPSWRCPERTAFELELTGQIAWAHPPRALALPCLQHFARARAQDPNLQILLLLPEDPGAPWFRSRQLATWHRVRSWCPNSDLFRICSGPGDFRRAPRTDLTYSVLASWLPKRRKRQRAQ